MRMLRRIATIVVAAALGGGSAVGIAACGEDRSGDVEFQGETGTETVPGPMPGAPTTQTETTPTGGEFLPPETTTQTSP